MKEILSNGFDERHRNGLLLEALSEGYIVGGDADAFDILKYYKDQFFRTASLADFEIFFIMAFRDCPALRPSFEVIRERLLKTYKYCNSEEVQLLLLEIVVSYLLLGEEAQNQE